MIEIMNIKYNKPRYPWDFGIHRRTPVGNPFALHSERYRDQVCDQYNAWFHEIVTGKRAEPVGFRDYVLKLTVAYKKYGKLRLFCWCAPLRCHGETIKKYIEEKLS